MGKKWERRRRRLVRRWADAGPVRGVLAVLLSLGRMRNTDAEDALAETALSVEGVVSAEFDCSDMFGGGWQRGEVVLRASSNEEATRIVGALLRAFAAEPRLEPRWSTPQVYRNEDGTVIVGPSAFGFPGGPTIDELRERYGRTG